MFAKILVVILSIAATLFIVLVFRQERLNLANEMMNMQRSLVENEARIWQLRSEVAYRTRPDVIQGVIAQDADPWTPIPELQFDKNGVAVDPRDRPLEPDTAPDSVE